MGKKPSFDRRVWPGIWTALWKQSTSKCVEHTGNLSPGLGFKSSRFSSTNDIHFFRKAWCLGLWCMDMPFSSSASLSQLKTTHRQPGIGAGVLILPGLFLIRSNRVLSKWRHFLGPIPKICFSSILMADTYDSDVALKFTRKENFNSNKLWHLS